VTLSFHWGGNLRHIAAAGSMRIKIDEQENSLSGFSKNLLRWAKMFVINTFKTNANDCICGFIKNAIGCVYFARPSISSLVAFDGCFLSFFFYKNPDYLFIFYFANDCMATRRHSPTVEQQEH
jgi:hypothetical protein